jgi:hypothetical protein
MAYESLIVEGLSEDQLRELHMLSQAIVYAIDAISPERTPMPEHGE